MDWGLVIGLALSLSLVLEGLMLALAPKGAREALTWLAALPEDALVRMGLFSVAAGLLFILIALNV